MDTKNVFDLLYLTGGLTPLGTKTGPRPTDLLV